MMREALTPETLLNNNFKNHGHYPNNINANYNSYNDESNKNMLKSIHLENSIEQTIIRNLWR